MRNFVKITFFSACLFILPAFSHAQTLTADQKAQLEQQLSQVEAEQAQAEKDLATTQAQSASLARDIAVLSAKIKAAQLNIKAKNLLIQTLGNDIVVKQAHISDLEDHIARGKQALGDILRQTNELDAYSLPEVVLSQRTITGFFQDIDSFDSVNASLQTLAAELEADASSTAAEKDALDVRRNKEMDAKYAIQQEEANIQSDQQQKNVLLAVSKGNEKSYNSVIAQKRAAAAVIRAKLFALRDTAAIPFGQALQYATAAQQRTGVRPAFLLAILTQESNLGSNVGQCYLTNNLTGYGVSAKTGSALSRVMNPTRDVPPFISILNQIGGDPAKTVVSCPQSVGWGGAMGPAQFIASTWILMVDRLSSALNISGMPDPWNPSHAIMAAAMYLSDRGAISGSYTAERNAACKYYSGSACGRNGNTAYGNSVMTLADNIQRTMIDPLQGL